MDDVFGVAGIATALAHQERTYIVFATGLFSLILLAISGLLMDSHRRARGRVDAADDLDAQARRFALAQYRRRMLASATIGAVGAAIAIRPLVPARPLPMTIYVILLVSACGWMILIALIDVLATSAYYRRLRGKHASAATKLASELQAARRESE